MKNFLITILIVVFFSSCIPTRDLTYFQGDPKLKSEIQTVNNKPYRLQTNDLIDIQIKATDEALVSIFKKIENENSTTVTAEKLYFNSYSVDINGFIRMPYLNELNVLGYTTKEVRLKIETELAKMFKNMDDIFVTVRLAGIRYTVLGEVEKPGTNVLFQNQVNVVEALANAGDIKITGNRKKVVVIRNNANGIEKFEMDLTGFDFVNNKGYYIQPNDIISIEPLKQKSWGTGETGAKTFTTVVAALSLITTTILLINNL